MRIGFDAKRYFKNQTGLGNFSRELVHALASVFPEDEFVLFSETKEKPLVKFNNLSVFTPKNPGMMWRSRGIVADCKKENVQVYHGLSNEIPFGLANSGIKSVVTIHDVIFKRFPGYYSAIDRWIYNQKTKYALRNADHVVAASEATAADLEKYYGFKKSLAQVIYQPVNHKFYAHAAEKKSPLSKPYFIYVSGFSSRKNHGALVEAFALIQKLCDWDLVLIGASGNTLQSVEKFIQHEKLEARIHLHRNLKQSELIKWMKGASAFVYPSLFEGFGIPLAEAAVCDLPMAVSDISVFRELAGDAALYFHPNRAREIADAMLRLTEKEHTMSLAPARDAIVKKIDPAEMARKYMELYRS